MKAAWRNAAQVAARMIGALEHFGVAKLGADTHATIVLADSIKEVRPPPAR